MADRKILISCGGLGMGNASRVFAIAQAIRSKWPGAEIHFFTWGKGHEFLASAMGEDRAAANEMRLHRLAAYPWPRPSRIPGVRTLKMPVQFAITYVRNSFHLWRAMRELRPQSVLLDSDYHFAAFLGRGAKIFYLGQAIDVVERARHLGYKPRGLLARLSFVACEVADGFLQRVLSDLVFVPSFLEQESASSAGRALKIPLVVREEFRSAAARSATRKSTAVTSGSGIESDRIDTLVASIGGTFFSSTKGEPRHTAPMDFQCGEFVVIQGGLTSISECIALRKPMLVVPIRGRAEQEVNARTVERLGLGVACEHGERQAVEECGRIMAASPASPKILVHGAEVVARHMFSEL